MSWGVVGHDRALEVLRAGLEADRLPHALLLTGPRQVGKRTVAIALARAVNCSPAQPAEGDPAQPPCGACRACRLTEAGGYPDTHLIELREGRQRIGIGDIQQLQSELVRRP